MGVSGIHKKKILISFILILLTVTSVVEAQEAVITTEKLNVRNGPSIHFQSIDEVYKEDIFKIIQKEEDWVEIQLDHGTGWVSTDYITIREQESETEEFQVYDGEQHSLTIPFDRVHVRSGPSTDDDIKFFIGANDQVDIISESEEWYEIAYGDQEGFIYKKVLSLHQKQNPLPLHNKLIVIDIGHGGRDVGATGVSGTLEKNLTYTTAQLLQAELNQLGAHVKLTRGGDDYISLLSRTTFSNIHPTDAFISIHYNSFPDLPTITGIGTYYYHPQYQPLAQLIQDQLIDATGDNDRGVILENYQVLRQNFKPSILVELGFISNREQEQQLLSRSYQQLLVQGISRGLITYFSNEKE